MMLRLIFPLLLGFVGACVLVGLGVWQLQRLETKNGQIAQIEAKLGDAPVALAPDVTPEKDKYQPVTVKGRLLGAQALVLTSLKETGPGYRVIAAFETADNPRKILVDLGFVTEDDRLFARPTEQFTVTGALNWPEETDNYTPEPELLQNIWFARDVDRMANVLGTEPVLVVASKIDPAIPAVTPLPVDIASIPNDHLNYAITWFSLAVVWLGMTALLVWRIRRRTV
jgi:surfeit locus 1 family protein